MPHRRRVQMGSFGSHFDELVTRFPAGEMTPENGCEKRSPELQEKIDIHAALLASAWQVDPERSS